jgi:fucose 4-O-acetylase-like acetyltransferase
MKQRDIWVDYAKGIGILLVVYGHVARGMANAGITINETLYQLADSMIYSFHMPLFFFCQVCTFRDRCSVMAAGR